VTHVGYEDEVQLAKELKDVDLIVGGHSHTLLGDPGLPGITPGPPYPTVVTNKSGDPALVVQAWQWGLVLGRIQITFDDAGRVMTATGGPIPVTQDIPQDPVVASMIRAFDIPVAAVKDAVIGTTKNEITREGQANLAAQLIADAQLEATRRFGSVAAFINAGGVRSGIPSGDITYGEALSVQPFGNSLVVLEVSGAELLAALKRGVGTGGMLLPSRGTSYSASPDGVEDVLIDGKPLDTKATYRITVNNFTAGGGDNHQELKATKGYRLDTGIVDIDALTDYIKSHSPLDLHDEHRTGGQQRLPLAG
ncbi:MAG TPA: 5'-nucleotidase C-terminal domain-containing protein, partial [Fimbriimonadaceae bacterium]|nr:5'-nucleotidase C-terminal domain-containing protein [Fimbriimonadaceae bacterium]